jgi:DNA invertase Pin-like site-specific DNA recombinase
VGLTKRLLDAAKTPVDPLTIRSPSAGRTSHAMRAAEALQFDVIVAEDLDRLFRSQADYHTSRATLDFQGVKIHTVAHGHVGELDGTLRAMVAEQFLNPHKRRRLLARDAGNQRGKLEQRKTEIARELNRAV